MSSILSDRGRVREIMNHLNVLAENIFNSYWVNFTNTKRAGGWSNTTWLAGGLALRLSIRQRNDNIHREA